MGAVYRARHVMLGKAVAVKVIRNGLVTSADVVSRFQREARAASNLNHPNIVTVHDLGQTPDGTLYIAMELIEGGSLHDTLRREGPLPPARAVDILRQVASALSAAHRKQIVHRDLKSHNLMLAADDHGRDVVKLVDFGIAKTFDEATQLTAAGFMMGTPHYMSPEQAAGKPVDRRADIYSLGVILYEMLTGQVPFGRDSLTAVLVKLATELPPRPSAQRPDLTVPPALEAVAMRCLEKNPADRFQSADEFAEALARAGAAVPLPAAAAAAAPTLVRQPAQHRRAGGAPASDGIPAARVRSGFPVPAPLAGRRAAIAAAIAVVVAAAIASGVALVHDPADATSVRATGSASLPAKPTPSTIQAGAPAGASGAQTSSPGSIPVVERRETPGRRPEIPARAAGIDTSSKVSSAPAGSVSRSTQQAPAVPAASRDQASGAQVQTTPAAAAPPGPVAPSVAIGCDGFPDICSAIRAEMTRAFQRAGMTVAADRASADAAVTTAVTLVSQTPSADFGTPMLTRSYSVELIGSGRGEALAMPAPRRFSFDPRFGGARLDENARLVAADALEAVRAFLARP
jgi:serine/threonine-protein kinase